MGVFDNYLKSLNYEAEQRNAAAIAKPKETVFEKENLRWFDFQNLINPKTLKVAQNFWVLLMGFHNEEEGKFQLFRLRGTHFNLPNPTGEGDLIRNCTEGDNTGSDCPFCEMVSATLALTSDETKRRQILRMKSRTYAYVNAIPVSAHGKELDREKYPRIPHILKLTEQLYNKAVNQMTELADSKLLDPLNCTVFAITATKTGSEKQNVDYACGFYPKKEPIGASEEEIESVFDKVYDLATVIKFPSEDELLVHREEAALIWEMMKRRFSKSSSAEPVPTPTPEPVAVEEEAASVATPKAPAKKAPKAPLFQ